MIRLDPTISSLTSIDTERVFTLTMHSDDTTPLDHLDQDEDRTQILNGEQRRDFFGNDTNSLFSTERRINVMQRMVSLFK